MSKSASLFTGLLVALALVALVAAQDANRGVPVTYTITDLGTLGGFSSVALGINDLGQVVGGADTADGFRHAFRWEDGEMTDLGTLPGDRFTEAWDINNLGQVVGGSAFGAALWDPFLWSDGTMTHLGHLSGASSGDSTALGINDSTQVVGVSSVSVGVRHAFLWEDGVMTDLGTLGGSGSGALDINSLSQVVGGASTNGEPGGAFLWEDGVMANLGSLGGTTSGASGINALGQVVGSSQRVAGENIFYAFLWENGEMMDLSAVLGVPLSGAEAINNAGQILLEPWFLYDSVTGVLVDLSVAIPPDSGWTDLSARDMNDAGQVVGVGTSSDGRHAFLMTPVPTTPIPAVSRLGLIVMTLLLLAAATIVIARRHRLGHGQG